MAILSTGNWLSEQRADISDIRRIESAVRNDFDETVTGIITNTTQGYFLRGFNIVTGGAIGGPANSLQLVVDPGAVLHIDASVSGTIFQVPTGTINQILNAASNPNVIGSFAANSTNYVGIDYNRFADPTTDVQKAIWNSSANDEISTIAPAAQTLTFVVYITTSVWADNVLPIAIVTTDSNNNVLSITDSRWNLFSLETGGINPDPNYVYPWSEGRIQSPVTISATNSSLDPFVGGDKQLTCLKDWMNAVMSEILEIKGTPYWFTGPSTNPPSPPLPTLLSLFEDLGNTIITGTGEISAGILPNSLPILVTTGNIVANSTQLSSLGSLVGLSNGDFIFGTGIPSGTTILAIGNYAFTVSSANATEGAVYSNNTQSFTVVSTISAGTLLVCTGTGAPTASGTLIKVSGTGDATITFSAYSTNTVTMSNEATLNATGTTVTFYDPSAITSPGQINWDEPIDIRVIGSYLSYIIAANPSSTDITLADDEVAYITLVRDVPIAPQLIFNAGSPIVNSVGAVTWTSGLLPGDFIKVSTDNYSGYYQILTINSGSRVTLTSNVVLADNYPAGAPAEYAFGSYEAAATPTTNRNIYISTRETVPVNGNVFWLFAREDNGGPPKVYIRFLGQVLDNGESTEVGGGVPQQLLDYIGSPSQSASAPQYVASLGLGAVAQVTQITVGAASTMSSDQYFYIYSSADARLYAVWLNISGTGTQPNVTGPVSQYLEWDVLSTDSAATVATKLAIVLNETESDDFTAVTASNVVTVTNNSAGVTTPASVGNIPTPFAISVTTTGVGQGNYVIQDGNNLTLAIKKLDDAIGNVIVSLDDPSYDEPLLLVASSPAGNNEILGPISADTNITIPKNSRLPGSPQQYYTVGYAKLEVFLNGQKLILGDDYTEVGASTTASDQIQTLQALVVGDTLEFLITTGGGGIGSGGTQGPEGPQGPAGADALGGPVAISTKNGPTTYTVLSSDCFLKANCASGAVTFNLPTAASETGNVFYFKKSDTSSNYMYVVANGSDLIDGVSSISTNTPYFSYSMISDGTNWNQF